MASIEKAVPMSKVHHGRNLRNTREECGITQEALALDTNMSQQNISFYEKKRNIDEDILKKFADALCVPIEILRDTKEYIPTIIVENNTFENNGDHVKNIIAEDNSSFNVTEKIVELYERIIAGKDREITLLKRILENRQ